VADRVESTRRADRSVTLTVQGNSERIEPSYPRHVESRAPQDALVGVWRLVSYEDRDSENEPWTQPFGREPRGVGIYHRSGLLCMQVFADPASSSPMQFLGYLGTFSIREASSVGAVFSGVVEHRMESASLPELLDEDRDRPFVVEGDTLTLGDGRTWRRVFARV
jgi:hypothetical protein